MVNAHECPHTKISILRFRFSCAIRSGLTYRNKPAGVINCVRRAKTASLQKNKRQKNIELTISLSNVTIDFFIWSQFVQIYLTFSPLFWYSNIRTNMNLYGSIAPGFVMKFIWAAEKFCVHICEQMLWWRFSGFCVYFKIGAIHFALFLHSIANISLSTSAIAQELNATRVITWYSILPKDSSDGGTLTRSWRRCRKLS